MIRHVIYKIILVVFFLLWFSATIQAEASSAQVLDSSSACTAGSYSRYEAWIKDLPCYAVDPSTIRSLVPDGGANPRVTTDYPDPGAFTALIYSSLRDGDWEIYLTPNPWGGDLYRDRKTKNPANDLRPRLRPGHYQFLFSSDRSGNYEIYLTDWVNNDHMVQLTSNGAYDSQGAWSPDGSRIAFVSDRDGNQDIYSMLPDGTDLVRLTNDPNGDFNPYWSPDGSQIIWVRPVDQEHGILYAMDPDGSNVRALTPALRFLQHPSWSKEGDLIAFDYDSNLDGWNDLAYMNADGSNLTAVLFGSYHLDYNAGTWPMIGNYDLLYTRIRYVLYDGQLYINESCLGRYGLDYGNGGCFINSYWDFYPDTAMSDITTPETHVEALPAYTRVGNIPVTVAGYDPGFAGVFRMNLQYRYDPAGTWIDAGYTYSNPYTFMINAPIGPIYFRSRGVDKADHWENWPPGDGDTFTTVYQWQLAGRVNDNRGVGIPYAQVQTEPAYPDQIDADRFGFFHRYTPSVQISLSVDSPAYGLLPTTTLSTTTDISSTLVLPPQADLLENGTFETGLAGWNTPGGCASLDDSLKHTGSASVGLSPVDYQADVENISNTQWRSYVPEALVDQIGNLHAVWSGNKPENIVNIMYSYKPVSGSWTAPIVVNPSHTGTSQYPQIALGPDDTLHAVWMDNTSYVTTRIFYATQPVGGSWTIAVALTDAFDYYGANAYVKPEVAVDSLNTVHVVWTDMSGLWYLNKPDGSGWSAPFLLSNYGDNNQHALALAPDDSLHVVYRDFGLQVRTRSPEGVWSDPENVTGNDGFPIALAADSDANLHLIWSYSEIVYYSKWSQLTLWSPPLKLSSEAWAYDSQLAVSGLDAYVIWREINGMMYYRRTFQGEHWSTILPVPVDSTGANPSLVVNDDWIHAFWSYGDFNQSNIYHAEWDWPQRSTCSLEQVLIIPSALHRSTLALQYLFDQSSTGGKFSIAVNATQIFTLTTPSIGWQSAWFDLSDWASKTVTVTFTVENDLAQGLSRAHLDDISIGAWLTPIVTGIDPSQIDDWTSAVITVTGENFIAIPQVYFGDLLMTDVEFMDEHTLRVNLPTGLKQGVYDVWVINPAGQQGLLSRCLWVGRFVFLPFIQK